MIDDVLIFCKKNTLWFEKVPFHIALTTVKVVVVVRYWIDNLDLCIKK